MRQRPVGRMARVPFDGQRRRGDGTMATTISTKVSVPTDLRDWLRRVDALGELQTVRGANTEADIGMATELLGRTRPSKATVFDEIKGYKKGFRVLANGLGSFARIAVTLGLDPSASPHELVRQWQERVRKGIQPIPADAEIVMEGWVDPEEREVEGPFGEWTGYYASGERAEPVFRVEAIYHRNDPIILASPPNVPPDEQSFYRAFMRSARLRGDIEAASIPGIVGVWCHEVGGSRLFNAISIQQRYAGHARQVGHAAASVHTGAYLGRYTVVVDDDIDVMDLEQVLWAMCTRSEPAESIDIIPRAWSGPLDPRIHPDKKGFSSRAIIDATRPWEWRDRFPVSQLPTPETKRLALERWGWLVGKGEKPKDLP